MIASGKSRLSIAEIAIIIILTVSPDNRFVHEGKVNALGISGLHSVVVCSRYIMQSTSDRVESSSYGWTTSRNYYKSFLPNIDMPYQMIKISF